MKPYFDNGQITIYHADARDVIAELPSRSVDLVIADPPYSSGARRDAERQLRGSRGLLRSEPEWFSHDTMTTWGFTWFLRSTLTSLVPALPEGAHLYIFSDWRQTPNVYGLTESAGYRVNNCLVWDKTYYGMGNHWRNQYENIIFASHGSPAEMLTRAAGNVIQCAPVSSARRIHPTEKPVELLSKIIAAVPGGHILDPFVGGGSTLLAALANGRRATGVDINRRNCQIAAERVEAASASPRMELE